MSVCPQDITPLQMVLADTALRLRALLDFKDENGKKFLAGDEWLFEGPSEHGVALPFGDNLGDLWADGATCPQVPTSPARKWRWPRRCRPPSLGTTRPFACEHARSASTAMAPAASQVAPRDSLVASWVQPLLSSLRVSWHDITLYHRCYPCEPMGPLCCLKAPLGQPGTPHPIPLGPFSHPPAPLGPLQQLWELHVI